MPLIAIPANDIETAGMSIDASLPEGWLDEELAGTEARATGPGHLTARLSRSGNAIVVRGRVQAPLTTPCARCLDPTRVDVDAELSLLLEPVSAPAARPPAAGLERAGSRARASASGGDEARGGRAAREGARAAGRAAERPSAKKREPEYEFLAEEAETDAYDGEHVVLDGFAREAILLELPNFPLCSEACPGIRPRPAPEADAARTGAPSVDPRLAPLRALRERLGPSEPEPELPRPRAAKKTRMRSSHLGNPTRKSPRTRKE